jgi:hypothetical protein
MDGHEDNNYIQVYITPFESKETCQTCESKKEAHERENEDIKYVGQGK